MQSFSSGEYKLKNIDDSLQSKLHRFLSDQIFRMWMPLPLIPSATVQQVAMAR